MSDFLTLAEVLAIDTDQIQRYGGSPGIRDRDSLESAITRLQTGYYADLIEEAAARAFPRIIRSLTATSELPSPLCIVSWRSTDCR